MMKENKNLTTGIIALSALAFCVTACSVDNGYDLNNTDDKIHISVNNLVVPIKTEGNIMLDKMLDVEDNSTIKKIKDGDKTIFAVEETGSFTSDAISVPGFTCDGYKSSVSSYVDVVKYSSAKGDHSGSLIVSGKIPNDPTEIKILADNVDKSIVSVKSIGVSTSIDLSISFSGLSEVANTISIENLKIQFMKGLTATVRNAGGVYHPETGVVELTKDVETNNKYSYTLTVDVTGINEGSGISVKDGSFSLVGETHVIDGQLAAYTDQLKNPNNIQIPEKVGFDLGVNVNPVNVTSFTGKIQYDINGINPSTVDLGDLPDILKETGTNINLSNPQLLFEINNPLRQSGYGVDILTSLSLKGNKECKSDTEIVMDKADNKICLAPSDPSKADYSYTSFSTLGQVLSADAAKGETTPSKIYINVVDPRVPESEIKDFKLGVGLNKVTGNWKMYAPLSLTKDSKLKYSKTWNDWGGDGMKDITIESARATVDINNQVPLNVGKVTFTLTGKEGKLTGTTKDEVKQGLSTVEIDLSGQPVRDLVGGTVDVVITGSDGTISPDQYIELKGIKLAVNGYYEK